MAKTLNAIQFQCLLRLMASIVACEGGYVQVKETENAQSAFAHPLIPEKFWCKECTSRMARVRELKNRWSKE